MEVIYYKIVEYNKHTCQEGDIVMEGIVEDLDEDIYPFSTIGNNELPYLIELRHFSHPDYKVISWEIEITRELAEKLKK